MNEIRCKNCSKLLFKVEQYNKIEIKCNKCKTINTYTNDTIR